MGALEWTTVEKVNWLDTDQFDVVKLSSVVRMVWSGYGGFLVRATGRSRADWLAENAWGPVTQYLEVAATGRPAHVDDSVAVNYRSAVGFVPATSSRRYGVVDTVDVGLSNGPALATCRHHWVWFHRERTVTAREPVPGVTVEQDAELDRPPRPPETSDATPVSTFRWTLRESDLNRHVNVGAYVERAENAAADADVDAAVLRRAALWFRRPSFSGERMQARVLHDDSAVVVDLVDLASQESCCVLRLSD
jgi:hypothetical protein